MLAGVLTACASACSGSDDEPGGAPTVTAQAPRGIDPLEGAGTKTVTAPARVEKTALLERVVVGRHEGFDRVVWQFRNAVPGYRVEYVDPPLHEDGSGDEVDLAGNAFVLVTMQPASGFDLETGEGELVYDGPRRLAGSDAGASVIRELVRTGDFEAMLTWGVGLDSRVDFRVRTLASPPRLVIDFRNH